MAGFYRIGIPGFLGNNKALYEATQDLIISSRSKLDNNKKALKAHRFTGICPSPSNPKFI
jgi:hypothetical protein